ncbi:hypothetical protein ACXR2U_08405 [Jatrophihabitans sp. YIM 134969]
MVLWIGMAVGFVVVVVLMRAYARHADRVEDDSSYVREEQQFTPYGQKYLDILLFRRQDD